jgi:hypothetical protein
LGKARRSSAGREPGGQRAHHPRLRVFSQVVEPDFPDHPSGGTLMMTLPPVGMSSSGLVP